jgi:hypothetical protein
VGSRMGECRERPGADRTMERQSTVGLLTFTLGDAAVVPDQGLLWSLALSAGRDDPAPPLVGEAEC